MNAPGLAQAWLARRGWQAFDFQREVWAAMAEGRSGLLHSSTGSGKTLAVWLGALQALLAGEDAGAPDCEAPPLSVLWITPMRALAADTLRALREPLAELAPHWRSGLRSSDTAARERAAQDRRLPSLLVTTPESLSLLLARAEAPRLLARLRLVVVDEWHELLGNKRGVQTQLALARLRRWNPGLMSWGLSATLGELPQALQTLVGLGPSTAPPPVLVRGASDKRIEIDTLLPATVERFPWAGHLGLRMLPQVVAAIEATPGSCLVFTNMRSQAELWYQALLEARPDWAGQIALHHGSLDHGLRDWVEQALKAGQLKAAVCTSSLDLGVDFLPVDRVLQIGSCKGVARLLQRAGRAGHAPGRAAHITLVPTHSLELVEAAAARAAVARGQIEARQSPQAPLDVLVQHLVTVALGGGFRPEDLLPELRSTVAYATLSEADWQWCLDFVRQGGPSLAAYPDYHRVQVDEQGLWRVPDARLARRHRANIGTIVSEAAMQVRYLGGASLGSVEEGFIARLRPGDCFLFGGRLLELLRVEQMTAYVRKAAAGRPAVPRWMGGRMALSSTLAEALQQQLGEAAAGRFEGPEMRCAQPLLALQQRWSALPAPGELLAETLRSREGWHLFLYPFGGRTLHLGLAGLLAWRAARESPDSFSLAVNDYGLELLSAQPRDWAACLPRLLQPAVDRDALAAELLDSLNASELARRRFREIARIAGLVFQSHPGEQRSSRQLQASSSLFYEVFSQYDPGNRLLGQARSELLREELALEPLQALLQSLSARRLRLQALERATPLAFPLMVERLRERLSNEPLAQRIARLVADLEQAAGEGGAPAPDAATLMQALGPQAAAPARAPRRRRSAR